MICGVLYLLPGPALPVAELSIGRHADTHVIILLTRRTSPTDNSDDYRHMVIKNIEHILELSKL